MHTASLRQQHADLGKILTSLGQRAKAGAPGSELRTALVDLSGKLTMHLAGEDRMVYPALQASKDPQVAAMATRFASEMGGLGAAFKAFTQRFATPAAIEGDRPGFISALAGVTEAIVKRVQAEERELYPAADRAATA